MKNFFVLFLMSTQAFADTKATTDPSCPKEVIEQYEELIKSNDKLLEKAKQLEELQKSTPSLELEPVDIIVDKDGRVFIKDKVLGKLKFGDLTYDTIIKLNTQVIKANKQSYGFDLKFKAAAIQSYEIDEKGKLNTFASGALAIEPFYYKMYNLNLVIGPRLYAPAIGVDITEHFGGLVGIGFKYNDEKAFFLGAAFDF
jgi:hypothetical protein